MPSQLNVDLIRELGGSMVCLAYSWFVSHSVQPGSGRRLVVLFRNYCMPLLYAMCCGGSGELPVKLPLPGKVSGAVIRAIWSASCRVYLPINWQLRVRTYTPYRTVRTPALNQSNSGTVTIHSNNPSTAFWSILLCPLFANHIIREAFLLTHIYDAINIFFCLTLSNHIRALREPNSQSVQFRESTTYSNNPFMVVWPMLLFLVFAYRIVLKETSMFVHTYKCQY